MTNGTVNGPDNGFLSGTLQQNNNTFPNSIRLLDIDGSSDQTVLNGPDVHCRGIVFDGNQIQLQGSNLPSSATPNFDLLIGETTPGENLTQDTLTVDSSNSRDVSPANSLPLDEQTAGEIPDFSESATFDPADDIDGLSLSNDNTTLIGIDTNVIQYDLSTPKDITTAEKETTFDPTAQIEFPRSVHYGSEGEQLFVLGDTQIGVFTLATPFDISTATFDQTVDFSSFSPDYNDFDIAKDGELLVLATGANPPGLHVFELETPNDISTFTLKQTIPTATAVRANNGGVTSVEVTPDGSAILTGLDDGHIRVDELSQPFSFDSLRGKPIHESQTLQADVDPIQGAPSGLVAIDDRVYVGGSFRPISQLPRNGNPVFDYTIAASDRRTTRISRENRVQGFAFADGGDSLVFATNNEDLVAQVNIEGTFDLTSYDLESNIPTVGFEGQDFGFPDSIEFSDDETIMHIASSDGIASVKLDEPGDISSAQYQDFLGSTTNGAEAIAFNDDGTEMFAVRGTSDLEVYSLSTPFDTSTASVTNSIVGLNGRSITFNDDGTKVYFTGIDGDTTITEFSLSTAFDLTTRTKEQTQDLEAITAIPSDVNSLLTDLGFTQSGDLIAMIRRDTVNSIHKFTMDTAFDIPVAEEDQFLVVSGETSEAITFNDTEDKAYIIRDARVVSNEVGTEGRIDTIKTFDQPINTLDTGADGLSPDDLSFEDGGERLYIRGSTDLGQYSLSTPFDLSSATFVQSLNLASGSINFNDDGTVLILCDSDITKFELSTPYDISTATQTDSKSLPVGNFQDQGKLTDDGRKLIAHGDDVGLQEFTLKSQFDISELNLLSTSTVPVSSNSSSFNVSNDENELYFLTDTDINHDAALEINSLFDNPRLNGRLRRNPDDAQSAFDFSFIGLFNTGEGGTLDAFARPKYVP
jgi:hypothetical protein